MNKKAFFKKLSIFLFLCAAFFALPLNGYSIGILDQDFGSGGVVVTDLGSEASVKNLYQQSDGKIIVLGKNNGSIILLRYYIGGSLDVSFGTNGKVVTSYSANDSKINFTIQSNGFLAVGNNSSVTRYTSAGVVSQTVTFPSAEFAGFGVDGKIATASLILANGTCSSSQQMKKISYNVYNQDGSPSASTQFCAQINGSTGVTSLWGIIPRMANTFYVGYTQQALNFSNGQVAELVNGEKVGDTSVDGGALNNRLVSLARTEYEGFAAVGNLGIKTSNNQSYSLLVNGVSSQTPTYTRVHSNRKTAALKGNLSMLALDESFAYTGTENIGRFFGAATEQSDVYVQSDNKILVGGQIPSNNGYKNIGLVRYSRVIGVSSQFIDFNSDVKSDVSVFRPSNGTWYTSTDPAINYGAVQFGSGSDRLAPADYDGDGKTDVAVFRPSNGTWYIQRSSQGFTAVQFGAAEDIPVPVDYDGDGKADIAVFRPSNGTWYFLRSVDNQFSAVQFGQAGDKPVAADYDGDGKADVAVNRAGFWYIQKSRDGFTATQFGYSDDKLVPADYDGDGKTDVAVFRPSNGNWYLQKSTEGFTGIQFGFRTDIPVPGDYDGDGRTDIAVVRNGDWYLQRSTLGFTTFQFGSSDDLPVPNAYVR